MTCRRFALRSKPPCFTIRKNAAGDHRLIMVGAFNVCDSCTASAATL
jgi:hypothetical protein